MPSWNAFAIASRRSPSLARMAVGRSREGRTAAAIRAPPTAATATAAVDGRKQAAITTRVPASPAGICHLNDRAPIIAGLSS